MLESKECDDVERMKAGIIGCGTISSVYLENLQKSPEVVAVADLLDEKAKERADEFNIENVYKVDDLLRQSEIELVFNLTVPGSHALTDVAILEAGKQVYTELHFGALKFTDHRANAELAYHVLEAMHAFQRSSLEDNHITMESTFKPDEGLYYEADIMENSS